MRYGALESKAVARLQLNLRTIQPKCQLTGYNETGLFTLMAIGFLPTERPWRKGTSEQFQIPTQIWRKKLIPNAAFKVQAAPFAAAHDEILEFVFLVREGREKPGNVDS